MIRHVESFETLATTPFADGFNALCWSRSVTGDFAEVVERLGPGEGIVSLTEERLMSLPLMAAGRDAVASMLADLAGLRAQGLAPELNCIYGYPLDEQPEALATDVYSFHADRAPIATDTWLCTYFGAPTEGVPNDMVRRRIDVPELRAQLLRQWGGENDDAFAAYLADECHDLHYVPLEHARPYSFGIGHLWRIAVAYPDSPVPPCVHRAPRTRPGDPPRLLLIS